MPSSTGKPAVAKTVLAWTCAETYRQLLKAKQSFQQGCHVGKLVGLKMSMPKSDRPRIVWRRLPISRKLWLLHNKLRTTRTARKLHGTCVHRWRKTTSNNEFHAPMFASQFCAIMWPCSCVHKPTVPFHWALKSKLGLVAINKALNNQPARTEANKFSCHDNLATYYNKKDKIQNFCVSAPYKA